MFIPFYHLSSEVVTLVTEISEQLTILQNLTAAEIQEKEETFDPYVEEDLMRAHEKLEDGLSDKVGRYWNDDKRMRLQMAMLFDWLTHTEEHPLISSCIFHYELIDIHPFLEGNERLGLFWQHLLLARWRPLLGDLPFENVVMERQEEYRRILAYHGEIAKTSHFIEFVLHCLLDTILREVKNKVENKVKNKNRRKVKDNAARNGQIDELEVQLSKSEQRVVKLLTTDPRITIGTLSNRLQLSEAGINKVLAGLRKKGIIERVGANKNGSWKVNL